MVGFADNYQGNCYNCAGVLRNGAISEVYRKGLLPNYGVFDEARYFEPGDRAVVINLDGLNIAVTICRDIWDVKWLENSLKDTGKIQMILNISASPFYMGKSE